MTLTVGGMHPHSITKRFSRITTAGSCPMIWQAAYQINLSGTAVAGDVISLAPFVTVTVTAGMISAGTIPDAIADALNADDTTGIFGPASWVLSGGAVQGWSPLPALVVTNQPGSTLVVSVAALSPPAPDLHQPQTVIISLTGTATSLPASFVLHCTYGPVTVDLTGVATLVDFAEAIRVALAAGASTVEVGEVSYSRSGTTVTATAAAGVPFVLGFDSTNVTANGRQTFGNVTVRINQSVANVRSLKIPSDFLPANACCESRIIAVCGTDTQFWSDPVIESREFRGEVHSTFDNRVNEYCEAPFPELPFLSKNGRYIKLDHVADRFVSWGCRRRINSVAIQICAVTGYTGEPLWRIICSISYNVVLSTYWSVHDVIFEDAYDIFCNVKDCVGYYRLDATDCVFSEDVETNGCGVGGYLTTPITTVPYAATSSLSGTGLPINGCPPQATVYTHSETREILVDRTCDLTELVFPKTRTAPCSSSEWIPCIRWDFDGFLYPYAHLMSITSGDASSFVVHDPLSMDDWTINLVELP